MHATIRKVTELGENYSAGYSIQVGEKWYDLGSEINSNGDGASEWDEIKLHVAGDLLKKATAWTETNRTPADEEVGTGEVVTEQAAIEIDDKTLALIVQVSSKPVYML